MICLGAIIHNYSSFDDVQELPGSVALGSSDYSEPTINHAQIEFSCCGVRIAIRAPAGLMGKIPADLVPSSIIGGVGRVNVNFSLKTHCLDGEVRRIEVLEDRRSLGSFPEWADALRVLESSAHEAIAARATEGVFVHSGVVGFNDRAILIPGRSLSGKTSLVMALIEAGAKYYSDEYAVIDSHGLVHAFPRAPRVRRQLTAPMVIPREVLPPLQPAVVMMTKYEPDAKWRPASLSPTQCLFGLVNNAVGIRSNPEFSLRLLKNLASTSVAYASFRGEARPTAVAILSSLAMNQPISSAFGGNE